MKSQSNRQGLALIALLCVLAMASCGENPKDSTGGSAQGTQANRETTEPAGEETEISYWDTVEQKDFGGKNFTIIGVHNAIRQNFPDAELVGDTVNDALLERDNYLSEKFHVSIVYENAEAADKVCTTVRNSVLADESNYHVVNVRMKEGLNKLMGQKVLYDLTELPYLNLNSAWWSTNLYENTLLNGHIYIMMGDLSPLKYYAPYVMAFNQRLAEEYDLPDMYDLVMDGKWTLDQFEAMTKGLEQDLNGDGKMDAEHDFYSYAHVNSSITGNAHFVGAGGILSSTEGGSVAVNLSTQKTADLVERLQTILTAVKYTDMAENNTMFVEDRALFYGNSMTDVLECFRDMKSDYGIIPVPKLDEEQESYYAYINPWVDCGISVPLTCDDLEMTGFMMEMMSRRSYETVRPALYDNLIMQKITRSEKNIPIMDMLFDSTVFDLNSLYEFGQSAKFLGECIVNNREFASGLAKIEKAVQKDIAQFMENIES